ncbi:MAG TPA: hypothetical protein VJO36_06480 [Actinomycetota bacterium]|nr:hypothetical protein [Actinomycetota bacterium]
MKEPDPPSDPAMDEGAPQALKDDARSVLERELYWAGDPNTPTSQSTRELRIALHDFAARMRADERSRVPRQEPLLGSASRWKRNVKVSVYSTLRPVTHRYDRLLADLATMSRMLAERLADAEAQIEVLRREVEELRGSTGPAR